MISEKLKNSFIFYIKIIKKSSAIDKEYQLKKRVEKIKYEMQEAGSDMRDV